MFYAASGILSLSKDEWRFDKLSAPGRVVGILSLSKDGSASTTLRQTQRARAGDSSARLIGWGGAI